MKIDTRHTPVNGRVEPPISVQRPSRPPVVPRALVTKGDEVEEWLDLHFFRPVGAWMTRALYPTRVSPDQVTLASLVVGLVAGHLFMYPAAWLNALGFVLFIVSDLFDSADGQLARMRGASTRFGRVLDGLSDTTRFVNLGVHLVLRLALHSGWWWPAAAALVFVAAVSHSTQSAAVDFIRHAFLAVAVGSGSELDLDPLPVPDDSPWLKRLAVRVYRGYSQRQARMFPRTVELVRALRDRRLRPDVGAVYRARVSPLLPRCTWLGQNIRFIVLGVTAIAGWPAGLLWVTALPMNAMLLGLVSAQERRAASVLRSELRPVPPAPATPLAPSTPSSPTSSAVVIGGD